MIIIISIRTAFIVPKSCCKRGDSQRIRQKRWRTLPPPNRDMTGWYSPILHSCLFCYIPTFTGHPHRWYCWSSTKLEKVRYTMSCCWLPHSRWFSCNMVLIGGQYLRFQTWPKFLVLACWISHFQTSRRTQIIYVSISPWTPHQIPMYPHDMSITSFIFGQNHLIPMISQFFPQ